MRRSTAQNMSAMQRRSKWCDAAGLLRCQFQCCQTVQSSAHVQSLGGVPGCAALHEWLSGTSLMAPQLARSLVEQHRKQAGLVPADQALQLPFCITKTFNGEVSLSASVGGGPDLPLASTGSDGLRRGCVLLSWTRDVAGSY